ncbi:MAG TPA: (Fe-S)-binding protein, partial [Hymenobacter sp.]
MHAVDLFIPCFVDQLFPQTAMNMVKVLEALGCEVHYNGNQTCCGQPAYNAGYKAESCQVATKFLNDFPNTPNRYIVSPSASCVGMVRGTYAELFENTNDQSRYQSLQRRIFEMTEFLVDVLGVTHIPGSQLAGKYTYHDSCAALRECGIREAPRRLLDNVQGLERLEMVENETCCGFGGTFAVKFEAISVAMA